MKKFQIRLNFEKEIQWIIAKNTEEAKLKAMLEKGYKPNDLVLAYIKQFFYTEESIEKTCAEYYSKFNKKPIEFIEYWEGDNDVHLEILRPDGYYESIYFSKEEISIAEKLFKKLDKLYNREVTPLEKYQASF